MSNALSAADGTARCAGAAPVPTTQSADVLAGPGNAVYLAVLAVGLCVLFVWIVRRALRPRKFYLHDTPGRPNRLNVLAILLPLAVFGGTMAALGRFWPSAAAADVMKRRTIAIDATARVPLIAAALAVGAWGFRFGLRRGMGLSVRHWILDSARAVVGFLAAYPICMGLLLLTTTLWPKQDEQVHLMLRALGRLDGGWKALVIVSAVVLAPLSEELLFRGLLQSLLLRYLRQPWAAVGITAVLFGVVHFSTPQDIPALVALGVVLGYNYERCGRLWAPILLHALFNAMGILNVLLGSA